MFYKPIEYEGGYVGGGLYWEKNYALTGDIILGSDITVALGYSSVSITGSLSGSYDLEILEGWGGVLNLNATPNNSTTANGTYTPEKLSSTLSNSLASPLHVYYGVVVILDGARSGYTTVNEGGTLKGTGTVGGLTVAEGAVLAPGHSPGCMNAGNTILLGTFEAEIGGTTMCTGYDQLRITGGLTITGGTLSAPLYGGFVPVVGQSYTIIENDDTDAVNGIFTGLAEGATFTEDGVTYSITYTGGSGNDIVITVTAVDPSVAAAASSSSSVPNTPSTGFRILMAHPLISLLLTTAAAGVLVYGSRRLKLVINN